jgi:hypothetical protein
MFEQFAEEDMEDEEKFKNSDLRLFVAFSQSQDALTSRAALGALCNLIGVEPIAVRAIKHNVLDALVKCILKGVAETQHPACLCTAIMLEQHRTFVAPAPTPRRFDVHILSLLSVCIVSRTFSRSLVFRTLGHCVCGFQLSFQRPRCLIWALKKPCRP